MTEAGPVPSDKEKQNPKLPVKLPWIWMVFPILLLVTLFWSGQVGDHIPYNEFLDKIRRGEVSEVIFHNDQIQAKIKGAEGAQSSSVFTYKVEDEDLVPLLKEKSVKFSALPQSRFWETFFIWIFPLLLLFFLFRGMGNMQAGRLLSYGKSKAKIYLEKDIGTRFTDVAGVDEVKDELLEVVNFLKNPHEYSRLGGRAPKGILLVGPPGTGKTLMARAVAGEADVPFFSINGSEFVELFVGMGAARVRDLFEQARKQSPCIIFIDELDALGKSRGFGQIQGGHDEKEQTLNQLLAELDGFDSGSGVVLLAATNRPEVLDPALLRAGRFDRQVLLDNPDQNGRLQILKIHSRKIVLGKEVDLKVVASMTAGFSGADLANLVNEAALTATREGGDAVELKDFIKAVERIVAGLERRQRIIHPEEKRRVAFHEMGHATMALALQLKERVQKVSVIPRGIGALGYTLQRPLEDRYLVTKTELLNRVAMLLGGRVSENIFLGDISTGASDDLVKASNIVRAMVTQYGMGDAVGLMTEDAPTRSFLREQGAPYSMKSWSEKTGEKVDQEVGALLDDCRKKSRQVIGDNRRFIEAAVEKLMEKETLEAEEIQHLWQTLGKLHGDSTPWPNMAGL